jgi:hypothetical protein
MMNRLTGMLCPGAGVLLSGCYEAAVRRPLMYKKGEYIGKQDEGTQQRGARQAALAHVNSGLQGSL